MLMRHFDEELKELQIQAATKNRLEMMIKELQKQKSILEASVEELSMQKDKEKLDVDRLERRSLANYFYQVVGKLDEKLTKEKQEAVKQSGILEASEILRLEAQITSLDVQIKELEEAVSAGKRAEQIADGILKSLSSAEGWGTWDLLGGGIIADAVKHSHLDEAQSQVERLQEALRRFKTELADVEIIADMQVNIEGFLRFADYFFDGLFADWSVMNRISEAQEQVNKVKSQIGAVLSKLNSASASVNAEKNCAKNRLQELVKKVAL